MKKVMLFLIVGMFLFSFVSADQTYTQNTDVDLKVVCLNNGFCSGSAQCNASIFGPNEQIIVSPAVFQNQNSFHNYTINSTQTNTPGEYQVSGFCVDGGSFQEINYNFLVTGNGEPTPHGIVIFGFGLLLLFILSSSVVVMVKSVGHIINKDFDLMDVAIMWGSYFALLGANRLANIYLGNLEVMNWLNLFVTLYGFPMVLVPVIAFFLSFFSAKKREAEKQKKW